MTTRRDDAEIRRLILNRYHHGQSIQSRTTQCSPGRRLSRSRTRVSPKGHGHLALQKERLIDEDNGRSYHVIENNVRSSYRHAPSSRKRQLQQQLRDRNSPQSSSRVVRSVTATGNSDLNEENDPFPILPLWCKSDRYASLHPRPRTRSQHGISEETRHITTNNTNIIERSKARRRSSSSAQFRTTDDMTTHYLLAPRYDVWIAFTISSCATTLHVIWILLDSKLVYDDDDVPHFTAMDALALLTSSLSFVIGAVTTCGVHFTPFRTDVTKSIFKTIDWGTFDEYRGHYRRDAFIGSMNLTAEWIALTILFFLWIVSIPFIVNRDEYHYSIMDGIEGEMSGTILWKDNLFYSSWISFLLCTYLWIEVWSLSDRSGIIKLIDLRRLPTNTFTKRWMLFLFVSLVVFITSVTAYTGPMCQGSLLKSTSYCGNLLTIIVMGGLFQLALFLGVAVLYRLSNMRRRGTVDDTNIVSVWLRDVGSSFAALGSIVVQGFTVALLTSSTGGAANANEMLYFGSWLGFVLSLEVCMRYSELCDTNRSDTFVKARRNRKRGMMEEDETVYEGEEYEDDEDNNPALKKVRDYERRKNKPGLIDDVNMLKQTQNSFAFPDTISMIPVHQREEEIDKSFTTLSRNSTPTRPLTIERYVVPPTKLSTASKVKNNHDIWRNSIPSAKAKQASETEIVDVKCSTMKVNNFRRQISPLTSDDSSIRIRQMLVEVDDNSEMENPSPPHFSAGASSNNHYVGSSRRLLYLNTTSGKTLSPAGTKSLAVDPSLYKYVNSPHTTQNNGDRSDDVMLKANRELMVSTAELLKAQSPPSIQRTQHVFRGYTWSPISSMSSRPSSILMSSNESSLDEDRTGEKTKNVALLMRSGASSVRQQGTNTPTIDSHSKPW